MIIINFKFVGNNIAKVTIEGNYFMNKDCDEDPEFKAILALNNSLLEKDGEKFKSAYEYCKIRFLKTTRGRDTFFAV